MMLADSRWCHHPPLGNCARCSGFDSPPEVARSNFPRGVARRKWVLLLTQNQRQAQSKVRERVTGLAIARSDSSSYSAPKSESLAEPSTDILARPPPVFSKVRQKPRDADSIRRDSLALEPGALRASDTQRLQAGDEYAWHFRIGPSPGDLAEVEAFCRIFRIAEQVHCAVMEVLCSMNDSRGTLEAVANGYNRSNLVDPQVSAIKHMALLEEEVVSRLGCIGALLHQQKEEMLGGRLSSLGSSGGSQDNSVPPLAQFRAEMSKCCEQLEATLSYYFPPDNQQFTNVHKKFRRLRNVCFDAGYPRADVSPDHADVPNWAPVRLWSSRGERSPETDNEVVFWRGGQLTEEGVYWLINKGFKVIVDLRAEDDSDHLAKSALDSAVSSGKLRHFNLPVDPRNLPTKDQVVDFARLAADPQNHPLYLHSQEGITRTSAMVVRWREMALRSASQIDPVTDSGSNNKATLVGFHKGVSEVPSDYKDENSLHFANNDKNGSLDDEHIDSNSYETSACLYNGEENDLAIHAEDVGGRVETHSTNSGGWTSMIRPFEAQRPAMNIFSKQAMSKFMKGRRVSPGSFVQDRSAKVTKSGQAQGDEAVPTIVKAAEPAGRWGLDSMGIPRAGKKDDSVIPGNESNNLLDGELNGFHLEEHLDMPLASNQISVSSEKTENSATSKPEGTVSPSDGAMFSDTVVKNQTNGALFRVYEVESPLDDIEEPVVVGDMCASTTGVVRLQSRKKAEMYLVRTDGFSCTREKVQESTLAFTHPSTQQQMLMWKTAPKTVLLLKKLGNELMEEAQQVASFLHHQEGMNVLVEPDVHDRFARYPGFGFVQTFYNQDASDLHERVDFVLCLGGDGVILHASNLFRDAVPPVVSFNLGSLGFLTAHPFEDFMQDLRAIIHGNSRVDGVYITLRMRLRCELFRDGKSIPGKTFDVLNEVVVDRGSNPYLCKIECYERNRLITKVQADGVIVATPTGSTAYSTSAGGSMVHPNVPCMLFTPICPHSLSFRPVILPDSAMLELKVPKDARSNAWVSFDGKRRQQLSRGDSVRVVMSKHPLPTVNKSDQTDDWFRSLVRCLNWNERLEQKALISPS